MVGSAIGFLVQRASGGSLHGDVGSWPSVVPIGTIAVMIKQELLLPVHRWSLRHRSPFGHPAGGAFKSAVQEKEFQDGPHPSSFRIVGLVESKVIVGSGSRPWSSPCLR
jgi:hypothetical protein